MKEARSKIQLPFQCTGRKSSSRSHESIFDCFHRRSSKKESLEAWPTSPVLYSEEKNVREKEKAHRYYERQLKATSWYSKVPRHAWIKVVEPTDNDNTCLEYCFGEPCGCVLVCNQPTDISNDQRRPTVESGCSSLGDTLIVESRTSRISRTSTEDEKSYYDNLCQFCKFTSLERRARKYGEWRQRWNAKLAETKAEDAPQTCTCAMDNLSFIEWKELFEQKELVLVSKADDNEDRERTELVSTSDYGTQKSKDSDSTVACREYPGCLTVKSLSLGYDSLSSIPIVEQDFNSDSSYSSTVSSESERSSNDNDGSSADEHRRRSTTSLRTVTSLRVPARVPHAYHGIRANSGRFQDDDDDDVFGQQDDNVLYKMTNSSRKSVRSRRGRTSSSRSSKTRPHRAHRRKESGSSANDKPPFHKTRTSCSEDNTLCSEGDFSSSQDVRICPEDDGKPSVSGTPVKEDVSAKIPTENDETLPADVLSEFLAVAKSIDEFYESIHVRKFLENRVVTTSRDSVVGTSRDSVIGTSRDSVVRTSCDSIVVTSRDSINEEEAKREMYSRELRKRIRSLERLCSFVDYSDDETFDEIPLSQERKQLLSINEEDESVWKLSEQSVNLIQARRSRSNTSSGSSNNHSRCNSTSGSGSSNSRCSTRQSNHRNGKPSVTSIENIRSPDSGFSERAGSFLTVESPGACQLGTNWAGSMQWDYTDWFFYYGYDCNGNGPPAEEEKSNTLTTIHETPSLPPQNPLDWDW